MYHNYSRSVPYDCMTFIVIVAVCLLFAGGPGLGSQFIDIPVIGIKTNDDVPLHLKCCLYYRQLNVCCCSSSIFTYKMYIIVDNQSVICVRFLCSTIESDKRFQNVLKQQIENDSDCVRIFMVLDV